MSGLPGRAAATTTTTAAGPGWRLEPLRRLRWAEADGAAAALGGALAAEAAAATRHAEAVARAEAARRAAEGASPGAGELGGPVGPVGPGVAGGPGDPAPGGWAARAAWAERLELAARRLDVEVAAAGAALGLAAGEVARCRAGHARAASAARLLDEARGRWVVARRRGRERAAEAEADDRPWPGAG